MGAVYLRNSTLVCTSGAIQARNASTDVAYRSCTEGRAGTFVVTADITAVTDVATRSVITDAREFAADLDTSAVKADASSNGAALSAEA